MQHAKVCFNYFYCELVDCQLSKAKSKQAMRLLKYSTRKYAMIILCRACIKAQHSFNWFGACLVCLYLIAALEVFLLCLVCLYLNAVLERTQRKLLWSCKAKRLSLLRSEVCNNNFLNANYTDLISLSLLLRSACSAVSYFLF